LKYINSIIGIDGKVSPEEVELRDHLIASVDLNFTPSELNSIKRAISRPYFGKSLSKNIPKMSLRHFIIWTLFLIAGADKKYDYREIRYIDDVAVHFGMLRKNFDIIKSKFVKKTEEGF